MKKPKNEQTFLKQVIDLLNSEYAAEVIKVITANKSGVPDLIACVNGCFVGIEIKLDSPVSNLQEYNLRKNKNAGGIAFVLRWSDNWKEELKTSLKNANRDTKINECL